MLSTSIAPNAFQSPLMVSFDPTCILAGEDFISARVNFDTETSVLVYKQDRELATQPVVFVLPTAIKGYSVTVTLAGVDIIPLASQILLPALTLYQETSVEVTFTPAPGSDAKPPKPKIKVDIRVPPTGGG